jgi:hypothetical protein
VQLELSETIEKDKKLGQEVEEEEYVLLLARVTETYHHSSGAPFVLSVSWFFSGSTSLQLTCYVVHPEFLFTTFMLGY